MDQLPELAIHLFALVQVRGTEEKCAFSSAPAPDQRSWSFQGPPSAIHMGNCEVHMDPFSDHGENDKS